MYECQSNLSIKKVDSFKHDSDSDDENVTPKYLGQIFKQYQNVNNSNKSTSGYALPNILRLNSKHKNFSNEPIYEGAEEESKLNSNVNTQREK